jgi:hypothetical protein
VARKREKLKGLDYESPEYWEKLLKEEGLVMGRGTSSKLSYVGSGSVAEFIHGAESNNDGRIKPKEPAE